MFLLVFAVLQRQLVSALKSILHSRRLQRLHGSSVRSVATVLGVHGPAPIVVVGRLLLKEGEV